MSASSIIIGTGTGFRLRRPPVLNNGFVTDLDPRVQEQLTRLHGLLDAAVFVRPLALDAAQLATEEAAASAGQPQHRQAHHPGNAGSSRTARKQPAAKTTGFQGLDPATVLAMALTPRRAIATPAWQDSPPSLAFTLDQAVSDLSASTPTQGGAPTGLITLSEYVDRVPDLSTLKYAVDDALDADWNTLSESLRRVLDLATLPALRVYLVAYAYEVLDLRDSGAVERFILTDGLGATQLINYAAVSAARELVADKGFAIPDYDVDSSDFVANISAAQVGLSSASFEPAVMSVVNNLINDVEHKDLIAVAEATLGPLPLTTKQLLARYIDAAPVPITAQNIAAFATVWLAQNTPPPAAAPSDPTVPSDDDFSIEVYQDDPNSVQISRSAILAAAQLYYSMVLGDELDVFAIVHYFTHKYLVRGSMEVTDPVLRADLQSYVFSNRFTDVRTGRLLDRSRPEERWMFYGQVFDAVRHHRHHHGQQRHAEMPSDLIINTDFPPMWKVLMLESATYLERAQASLNPDGFVSRQKVMQAVEDLQYDLSTHCIGMAPVAAPLIHAELNFCVRRILMHPEVMNQVVPVGPTWWRVAERLYMDFKQVRPRSTALYNKAKLGHDIIQAISDYNPSTFEDDVQFSNFISDVDAYITTQSILQAALTDDLKRRQEDPATLPRPDGGPGGGGDGGRGDSPGGDGGRNDPPVDGSGSPVSAPPAPAAGMPALAGLPTPAGAAANGVSANGHAPSDEWDF